MATRQRGRNVRDEQRLILRTISDEVRQRHLDQLRAAHRQDRATRRCAADAKRLRQRVERLVNALNVCARTIDDVRVYPRTRAYRLVALFERINRDVGKTLPIRIAAATTLADELALRPGQWGPATRTAVEAIVADAKSVFEDTAIEGMRLLRRAKATYAYYYAGLMCRKARVLSLPSEDRDRVAEVVRTRLNNGQSADTRLQKQTGRSPNERRTRLRALTSLASP